MFGIQYFPYTFKSYIRSRITILEMYIGELDNFELTVFIKSQNGILGSTIIIAMKENKTANKVPRIFFILCTFRR